MSRLGKKGGIPDRWLDYSAVGSRLDGTRFVAFKVPLKQDLNRQLPPSEVFGPWELLDALSRQNQELGLIIDLTFTSRYYSLQDVPDSLLVLKIFTAGHDVPSDAVILDFKRAVRAFLRDNGDNDKLIGVHCTHGVNRTGYLICRYLIDVDGMDPEEALQLFGSSRSHGVERHNYLQDLRLGAKRSNEGMEQSELQPRRGQARQRRTNSCDSEADERDWDPDGNHGRKAHWYPDRNHSRNHSGIPDRNYNRNPDWYPDRNPSRNPDGYRDRNPDRYRDRNPDWYPDRNHSRNPDGYRDRNPDWYPDRNPDGYRDRNHSRNPDGYRDRNPDWYPDRNHSGTRSSSRNPDRCLPPYHHGNALPPRGLPATPCWTHPDAVWGRSRSPPRDRGRSRYPPPEPCWSTAYRMGAPPPGAPPP